MPYYWNNLQLIHGKMPISLPMFNGKPTEWIEFRDFFKALVPDFQYSGWRNCHTLRRVYQTKRFLSSSP